MGLFDWVANGLGFEGGSKNKKEKKLDEFNHLFVIHKLFLI